MKFNIKSKYDFMVFLGIILFMSIMIFSIVLLFLAAGKLLFHYVFDFNEKNLFFLFATVFITVALSSFVYALVHYLLKTLLPHSHVSITVEFDKLSAKIASVLEINELSNFVVNTLYDILKLKNIILLLYHQESFTYRATSSSGFSISEMLRLNLSADDLLVNILNVKKKGVYRDSLIKSLSWQDASILSHSFARLRANYAFPISYDGKIIAILALSSRIKSKHFSRREFHLLNNLSKYLAPAIHNASAVTALKRINDDLTVSQSKLLQNAKMSAIEKLATGIAHEIHNPLTIISGKAQVLLLKGNRKYDNLKVEEVLQTIVEQTKRAADITRRLLMFSKDGEGANRLLNLENIINDTVSLVSYHTSLDEIKILKVFESNIPFVCGSLLEIRELFLNLLLNAIQSIGKSGTISITVKYIEEKNIIKVLFADTGSGIPKDKLSEIFDPFYTTKEKCVGLGLFICRQIVNRMGGAIKVDSVEGEGSVFILTLPVAKRKTEAEQKITKDNNITVNTEKTE